MPIIWRIVAKVIMSVVLIISLSASVNAFSGDGDDVTLQVQLILAQDGVAVTGVKDIIIRLVYSTSIGDITSWEKTYEDNTIIDGELSLTINGEDDNGVILIADLFDGEDVAIEVEIDDEVVTLELVSQPYAIKSRISDYSHYTRGIYDTAIREVDELEDGDILVVQDGEWVPISSSDGYTGISGGMEAISALESLEDISVDGLQEGDILRYDGVYWVNTVPEDSMTNDDVLAVVSEVGYLTELAITDIPGGLYPQITGIGDYIEIGSMVELGKDTYISGDLYMGGTVGTLLFPIETYVSEINVIGASDGSEVSIAAESGVLLVGSGIELESQAGLVISGTGSEGRISIYDSETEVSYDDDLVWDSGLNQLGVGDLSSISGVQLNVEGSVRVGGELIIGQETLDLSSYIKEVDVSEVGKSGEYSDISGAPDLTVYATVESVSSDLMNYYTSEEVDAEIGSQIVLFQEGDLQTEMTEALSDYETGDERDAKVAAELESYYNKTESEALFIDDDELSAELINYATEEKIINDILSEYTLGSSVSTVGKTGSYDDLLDVPNLVLATEFETYKELVGDTYATMVYTEDKIEVATTDVKSEILLSVANMYVTKTELENEGFAYQEEVNALSEVARTGSYDDLEDAPDLSDYSTNDVISDAYIDNAELMESLSGYLSIDDASEVATTGLYDDLINAPDISLYQRVASMDLYVLDTELESAMENVLKVGEEVEFNLSGYATTDDLSSIVENLVDEGELGAVAFTGSFNDLLELNNISDSGDLIDSTELDAELSSYVLSSEYESGKVTLETEIATLDDEVEASLSELKAELEADTDTKLLAYDLSTEVDSKIEDELDEFYTGTVSVDISDAIADLVSDTELETELESYVTDSELVDELSTALDSAITQTSLEATLGSYATLEYLDYEFDELEFLKVGTGIISIEALAISTNAEIIASGDISTEGDIYAPSLLFNESSISSSSIDWSSNTKYSLSVGSNMSVSFTDPIDSDNVIAHLVVLIEYSGNYTVTFTDGAIKWPGGIAPDLSGSNGTINIVTFYYRNGVYYGSVSFDFQ